MLPSNPKPSPWHLVAIKNGVQCMPASVTIRPRSAIELIVQGNTRPLTDTVSRESSVPAPYTVLYHQGLDYVLSRYILCSDGRYITGVEADRLCLFAGDSIWILKSLTRRETSVFTFRSTYYS